MGIEERIAKLEERIAALEAKDRHDDSIFDSPEWKSTWDHFDKTMGSLRDMGSSISATVKRAVARK